MASDIVQHTQQGEIILYQSDETRKARNLIIDDTAYHLGARRT